MFSKLIFQEEKKVTFHFAGLPKSKSDHSISLCTCILIVAITETCMSVCAQNTPDRTRQAVMSVQSLLWNDLDQVSRRQSGQGCLALV